MKQKILFRIIAGLVVIGIIFISGCVQEKSPTEAPTTPPEAPSISCKDSLECPSQMKCENSVCVDVGCIEEGGMGPSAGINPEWLEHLPTECCEGLEAISWSKNFDENCKFMPPPGASTGVCSKCGNGICEGWETECNCPEDCKGQCLREGETYMPGDDKQCCAGLERMTITYGDGVICTLPMGYVCTAFCGDGDCKGEYENACSCPEDCK